MKDLFSRCILVTKKLLESHFGSIFANPVNPIEDGVPDYPDIVKQPRDLGTILSNLENNEYREFKEWADDVELCWSNSELFNGKASILGSIATQMRKKCFDLCFKYRCYEESKREEMIVQILQKLKRQIEKVPKESRPAGISMPNDNSDEKSELRRFVEASHRLTSKEDANRILKIFDEYGIKYDDTKDEVNFNVKTLPLPVLRVLTSYARQRFKEMRLQYPK